MRIPEEWTFKDKEIAEHFDNHVREQLPWYNIATSMTAHIARNYLPEEGVFLDLGCATGNVTDACRKVIEHRKATTINVDNSLDMVDHFRGVGKITLANMEKYDIPDFDVGVVFLSLMFVPVSERQALIDRLTSRVKKGGVILIIDKVESFSGYSGQVISRLNLVNKLSAGANPNDVLAKELALSGVQRPLKPELLDTFTKWFQIGEFCGYLYEG